MPSRASRLLAIESGNEQRRGTATIGTYVQLSVGVQQQRNARGRATLARHVKRCAFCRNFLDRGATRKKESHTVGVTGSAADGET